MNVIQSLRVVHVIVAIAAEEKLKPLREGAVESEKKWHKAETRRLKLARKIQKLLIKEGIF